MRWHSSLSSQYVLTHCFIHKTEMLPVRPWVVEGVKQLDDMIMSRMLWILAFHPAQGFSFSFCSYG